MPWPSRRKMVVTHKDSPVGVAEEKGAKKCKRYSNAGLSCCRSRATSKQFIPEGGGRVVARCRKWVKEDMRHGEWEYSFVDELSKEKRPVVFQLNRGGKLLFWPQLVSNFTPIKDEMLEVNKYQPYQVRECGLEPRLHTLFASFASDKCGYTYGSIAMKSHRLGDLPEKSKLARKLAGIKKEWNIGLDLLMYRDGKTISIGIPTTLKKRIPCFLLLLSRLTTHGQSAFNRPTIRFFKAEMSKLSCFRLPETVI